MEIDIISLYKDCTK